MREKKASQAAMKVMKTRKAAMKKMKLWKAAMKMMKSTKAATKMMKSTQAATKMMRSKKAAAKMPKDFLTPPLNKNCLTMYILGLRVVLFRNLHLIFSDSLVHVGKTGFLTQRLTGEQDVKLGQMKMSSSSFVSS